MNGFAVACCKALCMVWDEEALVLSRFLSILLGWQFYSTSDFILSSLSYHLDLFRCFSVLLPDLLFCGPSGYLIAHF
jgi:hypothetical protein